ncbi:MAG: hypothetical protein ACK5MR_05590 [Cumulibacter sp.]
MMTQDDVATVRAIVSLADLDTPDHRLAVIASAALPTQQMIRQMANDADLGEAPPSSAFNAGWE